MKTVLFVLFVFYSQAILASEKAIPLNLTCNDFTWSDIIQMSEPYLDEGLHSALVMQGLSSDYNLSEAAKEANHHSMPESLQNVLHAIAIANCN